MAGALTAIETEREVRAARTHWLNEFRVGAETIGVMSGEPVFWHSHLGVWGMFGKTPGKGGIDRDWNAYGQNEFDFRSNIIVEINPPRRGIDQNLQGVFAIDGSGTRWILHQGRLSVPASRVTEADFIEATGLTPADVRFSDGSRCSYHKVAPLDRGATILQERIARFVAQCAKVRLAKLVGRATLDGLNRISDWENRLSPEVTGDFEVAARGAVKGRHWHGDIWKALARELEHRGVAHSNQRVGQYGPDMFTFNRPHILFEIKASNVSQDVFAGIGQLQIYDLLLRERVRASRFRKVLIVPVGMRGALEQALASLDIVIVTFERRRRSISFDTNSLAKALR